jgi:hypothetical protein
MPNIEIKHSEMSCGPLCSETENFGQHLKMLIDIAIIYQITQSKHSESLIFWKTAVMIIRK